jgi:hypothetical protein
VVGPEGGLRIGQRQAEPREIPKTCRVTVPLSLRWRPSAAPDESIKLHLATREAFSLMCRQAGQRIREVVTARHVHRPDR